MNRKNFLSGIAPLLAYSGVPGFYHDVENAPIISPYLRQGDTIGITCPAGYITHEEIEPAVKKITEWGFVCRIGNTVGKRDYTFGGTDQERINDFQQMLDDKKVKAILCARGGYGMVRLIDSIDFKKLAQSPKWIAGFSDITVLHSHLNRKWGIASIHSKMCNSFPEIWERAEPIQQETIQSIYECLSGRVMNYAATPNPYNRAGDGSGVLVGGNLKTLESLSGTSSDLVTKNKILFVEDTGEYLYSIDRMFWNLKRSGKLAGLEGLIIGGFKIKKDDVGEEFGKSLYDIVMEKVSEYTYPVCFDFPVGHQKNNYALKCGMRHQLSVHPLKCTLKEIR